MTAMPRMVPDAEDRAVALFICTLDRDTRKNAAMLLREAYRDGFLAAAKLLAEPSAGLIERAAKIIDPEAWGLPAFDTGEFGMTDRDEARAKARAVAALIAGEGK